jgi:hypothetical protein
MKRAAVVLTLILALLMSAVAGIRVIKVAKANFAPFSAPDIIIIPPREEIYQNTTIILKIYVYVLKYSPEITSITYSLDGEPPVNVSDLTKSGLNCFGPDKTGYTFYGEVVLENLAEGNHILKASSIDAAGKEMSTSKKFTIDLDYEKPKVILLSPRNQTYFTSRIPLIFTVNGKIENGYYFLDRKGLEQVSLVGNTTLTGLSDGSYEILIHVDTDRGSAVDITSFTINSTLANNPLNIQNQLLPITIAAIATSLVIVMAVILYKRKKSKVTN